MEGLMYKRAWKWYNAGGREAAARGYSIMGGMEWL